MPKRLPVLPEEAHEPIAQRVAIGFQKLGLAMKHQAWSQANQDGLSPTQGQILATLALEGSLSGSELARALGLTLPTISDAVRVLMEKGALNKQPDPRHPRASLLTLTAEGRALAQRVSTWPDFLATAVDELSAPEQEALLSGVTKMIRSLQLKGLIPVSRMCVSCKYFRPHVHEGEFPHHCAYVDAPMAARQLRLECNEHEGADDDQSREIWQRFVRRE